MMHPVRMKEEKITRAAMRNIFPVCFFIEDLRRCMGIYQTNTFNSTKQIPVK
jgi:hypothetical protein